MAYVIKITDLTGEGKPDLYYAEPRDMRRALVADINQAKRYATEEEAYDEIDDSDVAELVIDYGYYTWESDINGNVDDVDEVPGDAIDIITESKSLKNIRNQMQKICESMDERYWIVYPKGQMGCKVWHPRDISKIHIKPIVSKFINSYTIFYSLKDALDAIANYKKHCEMYTTYGYTKPEDLAVKKITDNDLNPKIDMSNVDDAWKDLIDLQ